MMQISDAGGSYGAVFVDFSYGAVSVDLDMVSQSLAQLARNLDELPHASEVARHDGPSVGVALEFYLALYKATADASFATTAMRDHLVDADAAIRAAVTALTAADADAQSSADKVLGALDVNTALADGATAPASGSQQVDGATSGATGGRK